MSTVFATVVVKNPSSFGRSSEREIKDSNVPVYKTFCSELGPHPDRQT